jgi:hypothetical protein
MVERGVVLRQYEDNAINKFGKKKEFMTGQGRTGTQVFISQNEIRSSMNYRVNYVSFLEYMPETDYLAPLRTFIVETVSSHISSALTLKTLN